MLRSKPGAALAAIGICLLVFYLAVRLLFIDDLNATLARDQVRSIGDIVAGRSGYLVLYLLWVYSFKLGMLLAIIGGALSAGMQRGGVRLLAAGGTLYLVTCYLPFIEYSPAFFGILGTLILVQFLFIVWYWVKRRPALNGPARIAGDLRVVGYYFLVVATWGLCGIFGIVTFALQPEIMMARGLQSTAVTLTSHVMVELSVGWTFVFLAMRKENSAPARV